MFTSINKLPNAIPKSDGPNPKAAQALQEGIGGQFGEMRTMMQYLFQNINFRGMQNRSPRELFENQLQQKKWVM